MALVPTDLIVFGFNPWSSMWKRTQKLVSLLQCEDVFSRVLFVNPAVHAVDLVRCPTSLRSRSFRESINFVFPRRVSEKITVWTPVVPPLYYRFSEVRSLGDQVQARVVAPFARGDYVLYMNMLVRKDNVVFWDLFERARHRVFDWSDDFETFASTQEERANDRAISLRFIEASDLVVAVNESLAVRARRLNPNTRCLRNGTNYRLLSLADSEQTPEHPGCARLTGPVIGYMGYLNPARLDTDLVLDVATRNPSWQFVFVGPGVAIEPLGRELPALSNVHVFDPVPYTELPGVLKCFDVCIIPNRINEHTAGNDPIKLFDYLASGRPIVSTPTAGIEQFAEHVSIARGATEFEYAIRALLEEGDSLQKKQLRLRAAKENSWEARANSLIEWLHEMVFRLPEERGR